MPPFLLAYLWLAVENKQSLVVSGGTATGKTTILNALSLFVPPNSKVVSIDDTPEINLPHEHWLPMVAREGEEKSEVSMFDLLKASLRERPEYIIVGEIRGTEAPILFQGMATGHAGLGTVHAEKFDDLVNRMTIPPINLPKQLLTELNLAIFMKQVKVKNNLVRRANSVVEIVGYNAKLDKFYTNEFLHYNLYDDSFEFREKSLVITHLLELRGGQEEGLWNEIEKRRRILDFMHKNRIMEFKDVTIIINAYYKDPSGIFDFMDNYLTSEKNEN
jgi:flagellar protein FlaI